MKPQVFPVSEVNVQSLHVSLAGFAVAELCANCAPLASGKLAVTNENDIYVFACAGTQ